MSPHIIPWQAAREGACAKKREFFLNGMTTSSQNFAFSAHSFSVSSWVFLRGLGFIYLISFLSVYVQLSGLYGSDGLLPVDSTFDYTAKKFLATGNLLVFSSLFGHLSTDFCLHGEVVAALCAAGYGWAGFYVFLWCSYQSIVQVGGPFLSFQWDFLLLETGFLAIFMAPVFGFRTHVYEEDNVNNPFVFLLRLLFASALMKLNSNCPAWWSMTALQYHHITTCIPNPLTWFAHFHSPAWVSKVGTYVTFFTELFLPMWLVAYPSRFTRIFVGTVSIFFQLGIQATGNYAYFNLLTSLLCVSFFDDAFFSCFLPNRSFSTLVLHRNTRKLPKNPSACAHKIFTFFDFCMLLALAAMTFFLSQQYFGLNLVREGESYVVDAKITFDKNEWKKFVSASVPHSIQIAILCYTAFVIHSLKNLCGRVRRGCKSVSSIFAIGHAVHHFILIGLSFYLLLYSSQVYAVGLNQESSGVPEVLQELMKKVNETTGLDKYFQALSVSSSYGLFAKMTLTRPELIILGSDDGIEWKEYSFRYKAGDLNKAPPIVAPHQPRLDWQMWFAALGSYNHNVWFVRLLQKLLEPNTIHVHGLLEKVPFPVDKPPKFLKADLYEYTWSMDPNSDQWWERKFTKQYIPPVTVDQLRNALSQFNFDGKKNNPPTSGPHENSEEIFSKNVRDLELLLIRDVHSLLSNFAVHIVLAVLVVFLTKIYRC